VVWPIASSIPDSLLDRADEVIGIELLFAAVLEAVPGTFETCRLGFFGTFWKVCGFEEA